MRQFLFISITSLILFSCSEEKTEYPFDQSPYVEFEDLVFYDAQTDTLELSFIVWDREGDVGFRNEDIAHPYHLYDVVLDKDDNFISHESIYNPPFRTVPGFYAVDPDDFRYKLFVQNEFSEELQLDKYPSLSCEDYAITNEYGDPLFLGWINDHYYNLEVSFLDSDNHEIDFREIFGAEEPYDLCGIGEFDARLFDYSHVNFFNSVEHMPFRIKRRDKYSVIITYLIQTNALKIALLKNIFKVDFFIKDRELNQSNTASSGLVTLEEITAQ